MDRLESGTLFVVRQKDTKRLIQYLHAEIAFDAEMVFTIFNLLRKILLTLPGTHKYASVSMADDYVDYLIDYGFAKKAYLNEKLETLPVVIDLG